MGKDTTLCALSLALRTRDTSHIFPRSKIILVSYPFNSGFRNPHFALFSLFFRQSSIVLRPSFYLSSTSLTFLARSVYGKGLLNKICSWLQDTMMKNRIIRVTRHVEHLHLRMNHFQTFRQLTTAHPGHHHIRQDQMNRLFILLTEHKGLPPVRGLQNLIPLPLQYPDRKFPNHLLILHNENRLIAPWKLLQPPPLSAPPEAHPPEAGRS